MIQKKRINNDVFVRWGVFTPKGLPVDLTEVTSITIEARPQSSNGRYPMVSTVVDNFVEAYFLAKDQKVVGKYNLYLTYTIDDPNIIGGVATYTIDYCDAFELLPKSCFVDGEDDVDPVNIHGIIASFTYSMLTEAEKNDLASRLSGNSGAQNLSDLLDVTISNLEINQILKYDGTKWVNAAPTGGSSSNVSWGIPTSQYTPLTVNGVTRNLSLNNHTHPWDTITNRPLTDEQFQDLLEISSLWKLDNDGNLYTERNVYSHGEVSAYNWGESPTPPVGVYNLKDLLDVGIINPQEDNILRFNGSHWVNVPSSNVGTLVEWSSETDNYVNLLVGDSSKSISLHGHKHEIGGINNLQDSLDFKQDNIPLGDVPQYYRGDKEWATLNTDAVVESTNLYYTPERVIGLTGGLYAQKDHTHAFGSLSGLPNTLDGYGIIDAYTKTEIDNLISSTSGFWVKSVGLEAPTGFTVSNSPIIYEGNIKLSFASGYSLPSNSKQYNWDLAFSDRHTHTNINVLNELTINDVNNWNSIQEHLDDYNNPHQVSFKQLIQKPSTLLGYGITDVYNKSEVDYIFSNITPGESTIKNVYGYDSIDQSFSDDTISDTFNAYTINRLHNRLTILEQGGTNPVDPNLDTIINWYNNIGKYWLLDASNDALYTNKNVYSTKEVSAYGLGTGGGGGGGSNVEWGATANNYSPLIVEGVSKTVALQGHTHTKAQIGLGNVDNTSDLSKPISIATQTALNSKLETSIFNTHNNDNVRHITGVERTKWDKVVTDFGNLEIGGRNYYPNTTSEYQEITFSGWQHYFHFIDIGGDAPLQIGDNIVWSGYVQAGDNPLCIMLHYSKIDGGLIQRQSNFIAPNEEGKVIGYHTIPEGVNRVRLALRHNSGSAPLATHKYKELKIEKGTIPTDWTPAPEDVQASIDTVQTNLTAHATNTANPHSVTKAQVGLGNVDNTSDLNKPISTAAQTALNLKVNKAGDTLTGNLTAPTFIGALNGNASTATTLATARTLTVGNTGKTFNGSVNVSWSLTEIGAASLSQSVLAGNGLTGGGTLAADRTLTLGTPSTLTASTTDAVTASSHTHAITTTSVGAANTIIQTDATGGTKLNNLIVGGDWKLEQVGTELQLKYNNVVAQRFLLDGSIVGLGEITAYGASTGGEGVALLRTGGTMTGNLTMSADIIMNSGRAIGKSNLPLKLLGNALTYNASNILTEANTATQIKMGNGWTIEQTTSALTIKKNGVVKGTFNA